jgi:hypothetical protein
MKMKLFILLIFSVILVFNACKKKDENPVVKVTYTKDVKPIFVSNCSCHLAAGANPNKWDDYATAKSKISLILDRINRDQTAVGFMPKNGTKLPAATITTLTQWQTDGLLEN